MGKVGEFGDCLRDLKKVGCVIVFFKLYFSVYERKKVGVMKKVKGSYVYVVKLSILGKRVF